MNPAPLAAKVWASISMLLATPAVASAGLCLANPKAATKTELSRYYDEETKIRQQEIQANADYENDKLRCKGSTGAKANACLMEAGRNFQVAKNNVAINRNNNNNTHAKALIDIQAAQDECNVTGNSPAEKDENVRHFRALIDIKKMAVDVDTNYANAQLRCASSRSESRDCVHTAETKHAEGKINNQIAINSENATWLKNRTAILRNEIRPK